VPDLYIYLLLFFC